MKIASPESYTRTRINQSLFKIRKRCKLKNIPIDIDLDYLVEIFPNDYKCPISREKMSWGVYDSSKEDSPSIDRIVPEKGYVKGNVRWVSDICNTLKSNRNIELLEKLYFDLKRLKKEKKIK